MPPPKEEANKYGIKGWAKNLADGRVEVVACGTKKDVNLFLVWLREGPKRASVTALKYEEIPWVNHEDFLVL